MNIQETIREFLLGNTEITAFRAMYDADPAIENYLQSIIDEMRRTGKPVKKYPIHIVGRDMESSMAGRLPALQAGAGGERRVRKADKQNFCLCPILCPILRPIMRTIMRSIMRPII